MTGLKRRVVPDLRKTTTENFFPGLVKSSVRCHLKDYTQQLNYSTQDILKKTVVLHLHKTVNKKFSKAIIPSQTKFIIPTNNLSASRKAYLYLAVSLTTAPCPRPYHVRWSTKRLGPIVQRLIVTFLMQVGDRPLCAGRTTSDHLQPRREFTFMQISPAQDPQIDTHKLSVIYSSIKFVNTCLVTEVQGFEFKRGPNWIERLGRWGVSCSRSTVRVYFVYEKCSSTFKVPSFKIDDIAVCCSLLKI